MIIHAPYCVTSSLRVRRRAHFDYFRSVSMSAVRKKHERVEISYQKEKGYKKKIAAVGREGKNT